MIFLYFHNVCVNINKLLNFRQYDQTISPSRAILNNDEESNK